MRTRLAWSVLVVLACSCAPASAQTTLSETDALARLSENSPRVRAIRSAVDIARVDVLNVGRWPNPRLTVDREAVAGVSETITTVLQPLPITGRRALERDSATALVDATAYRGDDQLRRARADVRLAYTDLIAAQARERELTRARERLQTLNAILERREVAGDTAGFDRLRAEREAIEVDADRLTAAAERARTQGTLAGFFATGIDPSTIVAEERLIGPRELPPIEVLVEHAIRTRGEVLALKEELKASTFSLRAADRRRIPEPELLAGTKSSTFAGGDIGSVIGLQAVIPLFDRGRPERALAQARANQAQARLDGFEIALRSQIAALRSVALERRNAAERYRTSALVTADDVERIAQVSYDAGERGILELLDAFRTSAAARVRQTALDAAARQAEIELEFVSGWEIP